MSVETFFNGRENNLGTFHKCRTLNGFGNIDKRRRSIIELRDIHKERSNK